MVTTRIVDQRSIQSMSRRRSGRRHHLLEVVVEQQQDLLAQPQSGQRIGHRTDDPLRHADRARDHQMRPESGRGMAGLERNEAPASP